MHRSWTVSYGKSPPIKLLWLHLAWIFLRLMATLYKKWLTMSLFCWFYFEGFKNQFLILPDFVRQERTGLTGVLRVDPPLHTNTHSNGMHNWASFFFFYYLPLCFCYPQNICPTSHLSFQSRVHTHTYMCIHTHTQSLFSLNNLSIYKNFFIDYGLIPSVL